MDGPNAGSDDLDHEADVPPEDPEPLQDAEVGDPPEWEEVPSPG
jgi:hypothetical protein